MELDLRTWCGSVGIKWYQLELGMARQQWQLPGDPVDSLPSLAIGKTGQSLAQDRTGCAKDFLGIPQGNTADQVYTARLPLSSLLAGTLGCHGCLQSLDDDGKECTWGFRSKWTKTN